MTRIEKARTYSVDHLELTKGLDAPLQQFTQVDSRSQLVPSLSHAITRRAEVRSVASDKRNGEGLMLGSNLTGREVEDTRSSERSILKWPVASHCILRCFF